MIVSGHGDHDYQDVWERHLIAGNSTNFHKHYPQVIINAFYFLQSFAITYGLIFKSWQELDMSIFKGMSAILLIAASGNLYAHHGPESHSDPFLGLMFLLIVAGLSVSALYAFLVRNDKPALPQHSLPNQTNQELIKQR